MTSPQQPSVSKPIPFLGLPPEIRLFIYEHLLVLKRLEDDQDGEVVVGTHRRFIMDSHNSVTMCFAEPDNFVPWTRSSRSPKSSSPFLSKLHVSILTTCRVVYREAVEVLYSQNDFVAKVDIGIRSFGTLPSFEQSLEYFKAVQHAYVTSLVLILDTGECGDDVISSSSQEEWDYVKRMAAVLQEMQSLRTIKLAVIAHVPQVDATRGPRVDIGAATSALENILGEHLNRNLQTLISAIPEAVRVEHLPYDEIRKRMCSTSWFRVLSSSELQSVVKQLRSNVESIDSNAVAPLVKVSWGVQP